MTAGHHFSRRNRRPTHALTALGVVVAACVGVFGCVDDSRIPGGGDLAGDPGAGGASDTIGMGGLIDCRNDGVGCNAGFRCQTDDAGGYECLPSEGDRPDPGVDCRNDGVGCGPDQSCRVGDDGGYACLSDDPIGGEDGTDCRSDDRGCNDGFRCALNDAGGFECLPDDVGGGGQVGTDCRNDGRGCNAGFQCAINAAGDHECLPDDGEPGAADCRNDGRGCNPGFRCTTNAAGQFECLPDDVGGGGGGHPPVDHVRVENAFVGTQFYLNPEYVANVEDSQGNAPAHLRAAFDVVKRQPTAVWLDRIATIAGTDDRMGLRGHLDAALAQQAASQNPDQPMLITLVVYDLPDRDCAAFASNGELRLENDGLRTYKSDYIDAIVDVLGSNPAYGALRIVTIIEPDSLPNIVTNLEVYPACAVAEDGYREGVAYAISELAELENTYIYLDIAHSGWLGWEHTETAAELYQEVLQAAGGADKIRGFATNTANYSALQEHFNPFDDVNANMDLIEGFFEWNRVIDEVHFVNALREFFPNHGFIIDTSRNGWDRRGAQSPVDARTHRGNWCNISGAGIGELPQANPRPGVDAYFWIKPPGESDGTSDAGENTPNDEGKQYDEMCGQADTVRPYAPDNAIPTDSLADAPHAGHWFHEQLVMLVENATPPLR